MRSGEVTLICGASGSGKSLLLEGLTKISHVSQSREVETRTVDQDQGLSFSGRLTPKASVLRLAELPRSATPLDLIGKATLEEFLFTTAQAGLAEPQLFVRPNESLSSGQKYRLQIALSFLARPDILAIDNFCEHLDRYTLLAVCKGIRRLVSFYQVALIVATAGYDRVEEPLQADQRILLRRGDRAINLGRD